jgi:hypothetical protein
LDLIDDKKDDADDKSEQETWINKRNLLLGPI